MSSSSKAIFLSYASQDAEAARRICEALRAAGVEVWFDQSELRGGDAWDQKIRKQIKECALFVPVISANTQARLEGYFRIEWKLAAERTHAMAAEKPFLLPVVIDGTRAADARVPAEFRAVQWTKLPHGQTPGSGFRGEAQTAFSARVRDLLRDASEQGQLAPPPVRAREHPVALEDVVSPPPRRRPWVAPAIVSFVLLLLGGVGWWIFGDPSPPPLAKSIAVLPFENLSPDPQNEFFADGMHDEVITSLVKIRDLTVISRASVMSYRKAEGRNLKAIAVELGVGNILEGSVRRDGNQVKVTVELIDARTGRALWRHPYTKNLTDVFALQSELALAITSALEATLLPEEKLLIARRSTQNQEAYDLYLRARILGEMQGEVMTMESIDRIVRLYDQAVALDPTFALAHVQLCYEHGLSYWYGYLDPTPLRRSRAQAALEAALRVAPDEPETQLAAGLYAYMCENDWNRALGYFQVAASRLPNDAQAAAYMGFASRRLGRLPEALAHLARSVQLNPRNESVPSNQLVTLLTLRRYPVVRDLARHYRALFPNDPVIYRCGVDAQLEIDGDQGAFFRNLEGAPAGPRERDALVQKYGLALLRRNFAAADQALADPGLSFIPGVGSIVNEPVALHRALVAFLKGEAERARAHAGQAITDFEAGTWTLRQQGPVMMGTALAHALAGRAERAEKLGLDAMKVLQAHDAFSAIQHRPMLGSIYLVLGRQEQALAILREMMTEPCHLSPHQLRLDPLWSRLKDDPRFEEILKSAKPL